MRWQEITHQLWTSHRRSLLLLAGLLILNLVLSVVLHQVVEPRVTAREHRFLERQTSVRELLRRQGGTVAIPEQLYVLASEDLDKLYASIPEYSNFTGLIEELLVLSSQARLNITQIAYRAEERDDLPLLQLGLQFSVTGDYEQIKRFVYALEQSVRLMSIERISLKEAADTGVQLQLTLNSYFRPGSRAS